MARPITRRHWIDQVGRIVSSLTGLLLAIIGLEVSATGVSQGNPVYGGLGAVLMLLAAGIAHFGNRPGAWQ